MRVLITSNITLPDVAIELGLEKTVFGGWISITVNKLSKIPGLVVGVAMHSETASFKKIIKNNICYYAVPAKKLNKFDVANSDCEAVLKDFSPDILHIEGIEMKFSRRFLNLWKGDHLVSIQGLISGIYPYDLGGIKVFPLLPKRRVSVFFSVIAMHLHHYFIVKPRVKFELDTIAKVKNITGRTLWDKSHVTMINRSIKYYHCPRTLREPFYKTHWADEKCIEKHSIFTGNAASSRKGVHIAVKAVFLIKQKYPNVKLYISGLDRSCSPNKNIRNKIGYHVYLSSLIAKYNLEDSIIYTGILNAKDMASKMSKSHVFLMSSFIENSPNTLAEAMMVGTPSVVSFAGGAPSMARDERDVLFYREDDSMMLAYQIERIFKDSSLSKKLSKNSHSHAVKVFDKNANILKLESIYKEIVNG
jgi:L-malate glycosyltransferase